MFEIFFKEQEQMLKRAAIYKNSSRFPLALQEHQMPREPSTSNEIHLTKRSSLLLKSPKSPTNPIDITRKPDETVPNSVGVPLNEEDVPDDDDELTTAAAKIPLDEILGKRAGSYFKDSFRYNPMNSCNETTSSVSHLLLNYQFVDFLCLLYFLFRFRLPV